MNYYVHLFITLGIIVSLYDCVGVYVIYSLFNGSWLWFYCGRRKDWFINHGYIVLFHCWMNFIFCEFLPSLILSWLISKFPKTHLLYEIIYGNWDYVIITITYPYKIFKENISCTFSQKKCLCKTTFVFVHRMC